MCYLILVHLRYAFRAFISDMQGTGSAKTLRGSQDILSIRRLWIWPLLIDKSADHHHSIHVSEIPRWIGPRSLLSISITRSSVTRKNYANFVLTFIITPVRPIFLLMPP